MVIKLQSTFIYDTYAMNLKIFKGNVWVKRV